MPHTDRPHEASGEGGRPENQSPDPPADPWPSGRAPVAELPGRYIVKRLIQSGGMGEVYQALDADHQRLVAIKFTFQQHAHRFEREIAVVATLSHPNVVPLFDSGVVGGHRYFVMPFIEGPTLKDVLASDGALPVDRALELIRQVGSALRYAHRNGVLHRDIKPSNVMLSSGSAILTDFGVVGGQRFNDRLTDSDVGLGTPIYASPEQISGGAAVTSPAGDVYALAATFYELLTGEMAFTGRTLQVVLARKLSAPAPSVRAIRPSVPRSIDRAISRALSPVPADRYQTVDDFLAACESPAVFRKSIPVVFIAVALVIVAIGWLASIRGDASARSVVVRAGDATTPDDLERIRVLADRTRRQLSLLKGVRVMPDHPIVDDPTAQTDADLRIDIDRTRPTGPLVIVTGNSVQENQRWQAEFLLPDAILGDLQLPARITQVVAERLKIDVTAAELARVLDVPTRDAEAWRRYQVGLRMFGRSDQPDDHIEAADMLASALSVDPSFAEAAAKAAEALLIAYHSLRDSTLIVRANNYIERALQLNSELPEAFIASALLQHIIGHYNQAHVLLTFGRNMKPGDPGVKWLEAVFLRREGRWSDARRAFEDVVAWDPDHRVFALGLARTLLWLRDYDSALAAFDRSIALGPDARDAPYLDKAWTLAVSGAPRDEVARVIAEAELVTGSPETIVNLIRQHPERGWFWWLEGDWTIQVRGARSRMVTSRDLATWYLGFSTLLRNAGRSDDSRVYADSAVALLREDIAKHDAPQIRGLLGLAYALAGERQQAEQWARSGTQIRPLENDAYDGPIAMFYMAHALSIVNERMLSTLYADSITAVPSPYSTTILEMVRSGIAGRAALVVN